jgi:spore coat protein A, manganese oxidase
MVPTAFRMTEFKAQVLPNGSPKTWVGGYLQPGQSARSRAPHPPTGTCAQHYSGPIPGTPHLHGGEVPAGIDGGPDSWFTSDGSYVGPAYYSEDGTSPKNYAIYRYPNVQEAAPIWFHDHTLGLTRLSVYAGLAGGYLITDPDAPPPANLPLPVPLIIQDRMFDTDGQLFFPAGIPFTPNPEHPFWVPEFIGDTIAVNGKVWPYLEVEPKRYRFLFLDGSNARGYELFLTNPTSKTTGPSIWQIGTDGGYLDRPVKIDPNAPKGGLQRLLILPGERADVIVTSPGWHPGPGCSFVTSPRRPTPAARLPTGAPPVA